MIRKSDLKEWRYVLFHPFDGFEEMRFKKSGSAALSILIIFLFFAATMFERFFTAFRFNTYSIENTNVFLVFVSTIVLAFMAIVANWALSTLWDGKGSFRLILVNIGYALTPYVGAMILRTLLSHVATQEDAAFLSVITTVGILWSAAILWFGMMQIHEFSAGKNLLCIVCTIVGMVLILFLAFLVILLFKQLYNFISSIVDEILLRMGM